MGETEGVELTAALLAEQADGEELAEVRDLTLRGMGIVSAGKAFIQTPCLEVLSLSHNRVASLNGFGVLLNLQYLNLNFNALVSLAGIEACKQLRELYLSNNAVSELEPLSGCSSLQQLSLLGNAVCNLDAATFTLSALTALRELDLAGNPVASSPAYRHRLVRDLPTLTVLDGEAVSPSEAEVAVRFFARHPEYDVPPPESTCGRGGTPPVDGTPGAQRGGGRPPTPHLPSSRPSSSGSGKGLGADAQLFRSEFLNNHPILLEYVVENTVNARPSSARPGSARPNSREEQPSLARSASSKGCGGRRSFVDRLRSMAAEGAMNDAMTSGSAAGMDDTAGAGFQSALEEELLGGGASLAPEQVIRRLLQICEQLERERDEAEEALKRAHGRSSSVLSWGETEAVVRQLERLQSENKKLLAENKNMYILLEENRGLKAQVEALQAPPE